MAPPPRQQLRKKISNLSQQRDHDQSSPEPTIQIPRKAPISSNQPKAQESFIFKDLAFDDSIEERQSEEEDLPVVVSPLEASPQILSLEPEWEEDLIRKGSFNALASSYHHHQSADSEKIPSRDDLPSPNEICQILESELEVSLEELQKCQSSIQKIQWEISQIEQVEIPSLEEQISL